MNTAEFLHLIHPAGSVYISTQEYSIKNGTLTKGPWKDKNVLDQDACMEIYDAVSKGLNTYHSVSSFLSKSSSREAVNARKICSYFIDVDSGDNKPYKNLDECSKAINDFILHTGIPFPSVIVASGNGYHCYWILNSPIEINEWKPCALNLKNLCLKNNLLIDKSPTTDPARVLRTPGSRNMKDPANPKKVEVVYPEPGESPILYDAKRLAQIFSEKFDEITIENEAHNMPDRDVAQKQNNQKKGSTPLADLPEILEKIDPGSSRDVWFQVGMGCVDEFGTKAKEIFSQWSQGYFHKKYDLGESPPKNFNSDDLEIQWNDWVNRSERGVTGITFGTVLWHSQNHQNKSNTTNLALIETVDQDIHNEFAGVSILENEKILGDRQNALLFAEKYRGIFLYVWPLGTWFFWKGHYWQECLGGEIEAAAKEISDLIAETAIRALKADNQNAKSLFMHAYKAQNRAQIKSMIELARSEHSMSEKILSNLNKDPHLLGVQNGVVDLRRGLLVTPSPEMRITKQCDASFVPGSKCNLWLSFLQDIFSDQETIDSVQRLAGYSFTGHTTEEIMVICFGHGANGKSVLTNVLQKIAGNYGKSGSSNLLKARRDDDTGPRPDIASLCGARFVSVNEMQSGDHLDEQAVKILASREMISARHLYKDEFTYTPTAKIFLKTNHKPIIKGEDDGIWRRLVLIPFERKFAEHERDKNLEDKLMAEADGILEWVIEGAFKWYTSGLNLSQRIVSQSAIYRSESDLLGQFLEDEVDFSPNSRALDSTTYYEYTRWCTNNGTRALSKKRFTQKFEERGIPIKKSSGSRYYAGITLKSSQGLPCSTA